MSAVVMGRKVTDGSGRSRSTPASALESCRVGGWREGPPVGDGVTGRVVVLGLAGGEAAVSNWDLVYRHQIHLIGLNIGILIQSAPRIFGEVMAELFGLIAAGVIGPGQPNTHDLADGPKVFAALEARATTGKLALVP
jgi:NADPH2:quinone reductase